MKIKLFLITAITFYSVNVFSQSVKDREFQDVPYPISISTIEFTVLDINFDKKLLAFKHVFDLRTAYYDDGETYKEACDCNYSGMNDNPKAGVVLGVYDLSTQEYLKTFTIYNAAYEKSECFDFKTSSENLEAAKKYFIEKGLDISKKPEPIEFEDNMLTASGVTFVFSNDRTMNDEDMTEMITVSKLIAMVGSSETIHTVNQTDSYIMASGGDTFYKAAYKKDGKIVLMSIFIHNSAMAGATTCESYQFSPVFDLKELKNRLK